MILRAGAPVWASSIVWKLLSSPITTPVECKRWGATVSDRWVDCLMSSLANLAISEAGQPRRDLGVLIDWVLL